jgi:hypothetical protein
MLKRASKSEKIASYRAGNVTALPLQRKPKIGRQPCRRGQANPSFAPNETGQHADVDPVILVAVVILFALLF